MVHNCFSSISSYQKLIKTIKPQILRVSTISISRFLFQFRSNSSQFTNRPLSRTDSKGLNKMRLDTLNKTPIARD
uniref:Uncharacterized protein n=1 Tax=Cucumis melo TaxID=3656 RepID=A0A9I9ECD0_CUCME